MLCPQAFRRLLLCDLLASWGRLLSRKFLKTTYNDHSGNSPGGLLNTKMSSYRYRDPHIKDKTYVTVLSLTWETPYLGRRSLY